MTSLNKKFKFLRNGKTECSLAGIIAECGPLRDGEIIYIIKKLCSLPEMQNIDSKSSRKVFPHPENIIISADGSISTADNTPPQPAYLPPELTQADMSAPGTKVYAMGILMLYAATGKETKDEIGSQNIGRALRSLIQRCTAFDPNERFRDTKELLSAVRRESGFGKKALKILLPTLSVLVTAALLFFFGREGLLRGAISGEEAGYISGFSEGFKQGFSDAPGIGLTPASFDAGNGNLSGNFIPDNGPFAVGTEDDVFYLDGENLCRMQPYTQQIEKIAAAPGADSLQYYKGRLYYRKGENICRMNPKTAMEEIICESRRGQFFIFEDVFYLYDSLGTGYLYGIDPDKGTLTQLNGAAKYNCLNVVGGQLYYISPDNGNCLCRSDIDGGNPNVISSGSYESLCIYNGSIYAADGEGLIRMDLNGGNPAVIISCPLSSPNVSDGGIFYISGKGRVLEWMSLDGKTRYTVVDSEISSFNVAGEWIFYRDFNDGSLRRIHNSGKYNTKAAD